MASFLTLPFELHHHIATFLLPPLPKHSDGVGVYSHDYVPRGSLQDILNITIACGPESKGRARYLREIYTVDVCIFLKHTVTTQGILASRQVNDLQRDCYHYLLLSSFSEVHDVFDTVPTSGLPYGRAQSEFEFWCMFFNVWEDGERYTAPQLKYEGCCRRRDCELDIEVDLKVSSLKDDDRYEARFLEESRCLVDEVTSDGSEWQYGEDVTKRRLRDQRGTWKVGWEKKEPDDILQKLLKELMFLQCFRDGEWRRYYARPGLIAASLKRAILSLIKSTGMSDGSKWDSEHRHPLDVATEYDTFIAKYKQKQRFYQEFEGYPGAFGWKIYRAEHAKVKDLVVEIVSSALGVSPWESQIRP
ncbi:hypothetical protein BJ508DRAFT_323838 [Ascobolus immersus RN42]|uniref:Uncharacterized protein n=1 Tax=Ascobolus immersus RN42 TaxID=1160509 RepID=A0A3N4IF16_ASCIM|nr:hypothetical protein BJ508DRAFT_323838 [Ascobolus immersus RN42]